MNILIIGDSWGVPNYSADFDVQPEQHTEFILRQLGHNVFNFSLNGASMLDTMIYALAALNNDYENLDQNVEGKFRCYSKDGTFKILSKVKYRGERIDWILWFHSEAIRDQRLVDLNPWLKLEETHIFYSHLVYRAFDSFVKQFNNPKTAIIGSQAIIDPILYQYHKPNFEIVDWRSEIVGKKLPRCVSYGKLSMVEKLYDSVDEKIKILDLHKQIQDAMSDTDLFFDRCHPGPIPHSKLAERLDKVFRGI